MTKEIIDGNVVSTTVTSVELSEYLTQKKGELEMVSNRLAMVTARQEKIIAELEGLIPTE